MIDETPSQAQHVISKLGGVNAAARLLGHRNPTTVAGWLERGFIPSWRHQEVLDKGQQVGLTKQDFIVHLRTHGDGSNQRPHHNAGNFDDPSSELKGVSATVV